MITKTESGGSRSKKRKESQQTPSGAAFRRAGGRSGGSRGGGRSFRLRGKKEKKGYRVECGVADVRLCQGAPVRSLQAPILLGQAIESCDRTSTLCVLRGAWLGAAPRSTRSAPVEGIGSSTRGDRAQSNITKTIAMDNFNLSTLDALSSLIALSKY